MALAMLEAEYADARSADLTWAVDILPTGFASLPEPHLPALAALEVGPVEGVRLSLHLLGASHRAVLHAGARSANCGGLVETVACLARPVATSVPATAHRATGPLRYAFRSRVRRPEPARFPAEVETLLAALPGSALVGRFAGAPHALTVLDGRILSAPAGATHVSWRTWHVYPQAFEIVETESEVLVGANQIDAREDPGAAAGGTPAGAGRDGMLVV